MRWLIMISMMFLLSGCNLTFSGLTSTATSTIAAVGVTAATGNPAAGIAAGAAAGVTTDLVVSDKVDTVDACEKNPEICTTITTGAVIMDFIHWIIGGAVGLIVLAWLIPGPQSLFFWKKR